MKADAVPCFTTVSDRLSDSWFAHEKNPTIIEAVNCETLKDLTPPIVKYTPRDLGDSLAFKPLTISKKLTLKNRMIRAAAFGGSTVNDLIDCHREVAKGGAAMTTIAYACVSPDGRTFKQQLLSVTCYLIFLPYPP